MPRNDFDEKLDEFKDSKENYREKLEDNNTDQDNEKDFIEELDDELDENNKDLDFVENLEDSLEEQEINKDFIDDIEDKLENINHNRNFFESIEENIKHDIKENYLGKIADEQSVNNQTTKEKNKIKAEKNIRTDIKNSEKSEVNEKITSQEKFIEKKEKNDDFKKETVKKNNELKRSNELAEMIGIGLGDGSIPKNKSHFRVTSNKSEEIKYTQHINDLMQKVFKKKPGIYEPKDADAIKQTISSKKIVNDLIDHGLTAGDKKENQVNVPQWIKENKEYQKDCLRGLMDTDGSIHVHKYTKLIRISFKNSSYPLMEDFKEMCKSNDINSSKIYPVKGENTYDLKIENKKDVTKFINEIQPKKWEHRAETIGVVLKSISNPEKRMEIESELSQSYPDKRVHYTRKYTDHLKNLCVKHGYNVNKDSIIKEISDALTYSKKYTKLTNEEREKLNDYVRKITNDLKQKWKKY